MTFVQIAQRNAAADGVQARFELGNAAALPAEEGSADFVVCRAAFRGMLIKRAYRLEEIWRMAIQAGWVEPRIDSSPVGFEAWLTKI